MVEFYYYLPRKACLKKLYYLKKNFLRYACFSLNALYMLRLLERNVY